VRRGVTHLWCIGRAEVTGGRVYWDVSQGCGGSGMCIGL